MAPIADKLAVIPAMRYPVTAAGVRFIKFLALLLFLVNIRSWPLAWHIRVFHPATVLRFRFLLLRLSLIFKPRNVRQRIRAQWLGALSPVGQNPLDLVETWKGWASPDDCDFNLHLSNSCYAKNLDSARLQHALKCFPTLFRAGGWMALGGTHYNFLREIPILARYQVRLSIGSWDNKWIYIVARYVSHSKKKRTTAASASNPSARLLSAPPTKPTHRAAMSSISSIASIASEPDFDGQFLGGPGAAPYPVVHTPGTPESQPEDTPAPRDGPPTPTSPTFPNADSAPLLAEKLHEHANGHAHRRAPAPAHVEPDGATLHCVAVSKLCFKIGRITVPPALVLASEGLCAGPGVYGGDARKAFSHAAPPPFWHHVERLRGDGVDLRALRAFFAGGWRAVPPEERWWEEALGGELEERRAAGMEALGALKRSMEGVQRM
ncbi:hypothetical protein WOLCODRAFT_138078 [Wolfiporia cocos MD-104 SS10]|uniref:Thioesterase/thiol ester dehydrase-isomerase n=1 Tax=Wolfiporia cocos (strain MD-104) TaxID=742152 RepID=A0A2H3K1C9_WOLCO|nr:hypothetical protein WOLCODRAFT_138078 [Wolfiporia cocos MD-104 SS10]